MRRTLARRTAAEAEATRQRILRAAHQLFAAHGFAATSTNAVVAEAGVTRGALYHHFADKAALFRAVFLELEAQLDREAGEAALARLDDGVLPAFVAGCSACLDFMTRADYHQIAVVDAPAVLGSAEWHKIDAGIGMATMQAGLDALDGEGLLRVPVTRALTVLLFGALTEAGITLSRAEAGAPGKDELLDALVGLVVGPSPGGGGTGRAASAGRGAGAN